MQRSLVVMACSGTYAAHRFSPLAQITPANAANLGPVLEFQTGGGSAANPISFLLDGKQHVALASGQALFVFALP